VSAIFPAATDDYTIFSRHLATLVRGELPTFFSMVISHADGVGVATYSTGHAMLEAANAFLDGLNAEAPTQPPFPRPPVRPPALSTAFTPKANSYQPA